MNDLQEKVVNIPENSSTSEPNSEPTSKVEVPPEKGILKSDGRQKPRTEKQILATARMKEARENERKRKMTYSEPTNEKGTSWSPEEKDIALASAMFMDMRKTAKETKKEKEWENQINTIMNGRLDEFEERLVNLFSEPIDHFMQRGRKKQKKNETPDEEKVPANTSSSTVQMKKDQEYKSNRSTNPFIASLK